MAAILILGYLAGLILTLALARAAGQEPPLPEPIDLEADPDSYDPETDRGHWDR